MSSTIHLLLEQAEAERDAAQVRLLQADEAARQAHAQAEQLHAYRADYRRRAPALNGAGASIELVRCHHGFVQRLDQAIEQQRGQLATLELQAAAQRDTLLEREVRVASVKKLIARRLQEAQRQLARTEQRHTDEAAQRVTRGRGSGFGALSSRH